MTRTISGCDLESIRSICGRRFLHEIHCQRPKIAAGVLSRERRNGAAVYSTAQENSEWNVASKLKPNRILEQFNKFMTGLFFSAPPCFLPRYLPIALDFYSAAVDYQKV